MKRVITATALAVATAVIPSFAQVGDSRGTGGLPQTVQWGMQQAMMDLEAKSLGITEETMSERVGADVLKDFVDGAVLRLVLAPSGSFTAYTLEGGDLVSFKLGKQSIELSGEGEWEDPWVARSGEYELPKKPQKLLLNLNAGGQEVEVECYNKFGKVKDPVTYYVGPLNGLFCMGLAEDETG